MGVYFAITEDFRAIKIGFTTDPSKRLAELQVGNFHDLNLVFVRYLQKDTEKELHDRFKKYKKRGEWFFLVSEIRDCIKTFAEGSIECWGDNNKGFIERVFESKQIEENDEQVEKYVERFEAREVKEEQRVKPGRKKKEVVKTIGKREKKRIEKFDSLMQDFIRSQREYK